MDARAEVSGRDETLAAGLYTGMAELTLLRTQVTHFDYTIRPGRLLRDLEVAFGEGLEQAMSPEHQALVESGEEQSAEDISRAYRMRGVQRQAFLR